MELFPYCVPLWRGQGNLYLHQTFAYGAVFTVQFLGDAFLMAAFTRTACKRALSVPESKSLGLTRIPSTHTPSGYHNM